MVFSQNCTTLMQKSVPKRKRKYRKKNHDSTQLGKFTFWVFLTFKPSKNSLFPIVGYFLFGKGPVNALPNGFNAFCLHLKKLKNNNNNQKIILYILPEVLRICKEVHMILVFDNTSMSFHLIPSMFLKLTFQMLMCNTIPNVILIPSPSVNKIYYFFYS